MREADVASFTGVDKRDMGTGYVWYSIPHGGTEPFNILMSLCFRSGILDSVSMAVNDSDIESTWSDWSEDKERTRADRTETWLTAQGYPCGTYPWGGIWASYDPKCGSGSAGVRYNSEQPMDSNSH